MDTDVDPWNTHCRPRSLAACHAALLIALLGLTTLDVAPLAPQKQHAGDARSIDCIVAPRFSRA